MADKKITQLPAATVVNMTDLLVKVNDPGGTPATQKATFTQVFSDASSVLAINRDSRTLNDTSAITSINWGSRNLSDATGGNSVDWTGRELFDNSNVTAIDWRFRLMKDSAGALIYNWNTGTMSKDLLFTDATFDIGKAGATRPRDMFMSRNLVIGGTTQHVGNIISDLLFTDATFDIGKAGATRPRHLFLSGSITLASGITAGATISTNGQSKGSTLKFTTSSGLLDQNDSQLLTTRQLAVADASGGTFIDSQARTAINDLLARLRNHGLIAT